MLAKRVIPCLDVDRGRVVKGTNFVQLRDAGDPVEVAARYESEGDAFVPAYLELLRSGGSRSPEELGAIVGCDLADPGFWDAGLSIVEKQLEAAEAAAAAAGRI